MGVRAIAVICGVLLAGSVAAGQGTGAWQVQKDLLDAQLTNLQAIRAKDWAEAQQKKAQYDQHVRRTSPTSPFDSIAAHTIDRVAAEAQQASGRVEMADRLMADLQSRLKALGPSPTRSEDPGAAARLEAEQAMLVAEQAAWQSIRDSAWETQARKQREYNAWVRRNPEQVVDRVGQEANVAIGWVEILDRMLNANSQRLGTIDKNLAATGTRAATEAARQPPASPPGTSGWYREGAPVIEKAIKPPDACYPSSVLDVSDGAATGTRTWVDCSNASKCSGTYVGRVTWTSPPAYLEPKQTVTLTATAGTTAQNTCGYRNFSSGATIRLNDSAFVQVGESQYSGPPKAAGSFTVPSGKPGAKLLIQVAVQAASVNGRVTYTYVYR